MDRDEKSGTKEQSREVAGRRHLSMHEDVPLWCDCCPCEPEPRWQAVEDEMEDDRRTRADDPDRPPGLAGRTEDAPPSASAAE